MQFILYVILVSVFALALRYPNRALFWYKGERTSILSLAIYGPTILFGALIIYGIYWIRAEGRRFDKEERIKDSISQLDKKAKESTLTIPSDDHFIFLNKKFEETRIKESGKYLTNRMDLYYYNPKYGRKFDKEAFTRLCYKSKETWDGVFYFAVVFDSQESARFPDNPFTGYYDADEEAMSHLWAIYTFNRLNGFEEVFMYR